MLAGEFGTASRLSPKALRLYHEQGLLIATHVDPATGYRSYSRDQIPRARLIGRLRQLDLPLARIAPLLDLKPSERHLALQSWLDEQAEQLRHRRQIVEVLGEDEPPRLTTVGTRQVHEQKLLTRERRVHIDELDAFIEESHHLLLTRLREAGQATAGPLQVHFHGLVTQDSDGPVEVALAFEVSAEPAADLRIRLSPAQHQVFVPVLRKDADFPRILGIYDALERWIDENHFTCTGSPIEFHPGAGGSYFDIAYPVCAERN